MPQHFRAYFTLKKNLIAFTIANQSQVENKKYIHQAIKLTAKPNEEQWRIHKISTNHHSKIEARIFLQHLYFRLISHLV